ncbi:MAG: hypothetical protein GYA55_01615 [SAR324 cluster bacterium]|uniref:DUF2802 domain-containing protein n=1 Tax=SAR324 cluster bacterium TaxID=2024889 RepID=A0A7X9IKD2_9DELT|nr:hypothetical protein [SAR324 cluster bacterium]
MITYDVWKLLVDIALCASLIFLSLRFFQTGYLNSQSRKSKELELTLRKLIQEAKDAGVELNDQLYRRQLALEKALSNIEGAEERIRSVSELADEKCKSIDSLLSRTHGVMNELKQVSSEPNNVNSSTSRRNLREEITQENSIEIQGSATRQRPTQNKQAKVSSANRAYAAPQRPIPRPKADVKDPYENWLDEEASIDEAAFAKTSKLRDSIEKEISHQEPLASVKTSMPMQTSTSASAGARLQAALMANKQHGQTGGQRIVEDMEKIYQLAENLLRSGHDVDAVVMKTRLPNRRVQALADMVERERSYGFEEEESGSGKESNLGALPSSRQGARSI